ncbi:SDR family NAD(P)-dependent oxidoreductase [Amycolatopsis endophytica]|uniref:Short-subunit dehydrogenase n=1 Tax=Amycolatopsis endophytica TaxID=860233 RepID=A0A853BDD6_9PSEU|nr:SDR family NAD(P)-dependent oxidoreductase [Amycolatopsis endophytica]NYI93383.1 short-subunit dehydrogenase [Amycolatopsis endophytica]
MRDYVFDGGTAVVTGAASGIGEALSHALAARGSNLVLLDRDADRLAAVAKAVGSTVDVSAHVVDLSSERETAEVAQRVLAENPRLTLLVNNAGVALGGRFDQLTLEEFGWVLDVNFRAPVQLTHALLPALKAARGSHIVNVSSVFGLIAPPGQSAYAASKFAVRGFTEAIRHELAGKVGVTSVHPGGIRTRIAESARVGSGVPGGMDTRKWERVLRIPPATAAEAIVDAIEHRKPRVLIGWSAKIPDLLVRLLPGAHSRLLGRLR